MNGNLFNSQGAHVGVVDGAAIFDLKGQKLYDLKGMNIYRLSGELVGHLNDALPPKRPTGRLTSQSDRRFCATAVGTGAVTLSRKTRFLVPLQ